MLKHVSNACMFSNLKANFDGESCQGTSGRRILPVSLPTSIKPCRSPSYQDNPYATSHTRNAAIQVQDAPAAENLSPVMLTIADQGQLPCTGIGHVAGDIEKIFSQPDYGSCCATRIGGAIKMPCGSKREGKLKQRTTIDGRTRAENAHQRVACFVHCQVCAVENREPALPR